MIKKIVLYSLAASFLSSCVAVKEYEKIRINDPDMALGTKNIHRLETAFQAYREASAGANGGKTGGGCGCN